VKITAVPASVYPMTQTSIDLDSLRPLCREVRFKAGETLRHKGQHYTEMYLLLDGAVEVDRQTKSASEIVLAGAGTPIGEIGFLHGASATATVMAKTGISALVIDGASLLHMEEQKPALAVQLRRQLATVADERMSENLLLDSSTKTFAAAPEIKILLCQNREQLERAQQLRYKVYCEELHRQSPHANHEKRAISDELDDTGHTFAALKGREVIGTGRVNFPSEGPIGLYEELYGMRGSKNHPRGTAVITKFIVSKANRGGPTAIKLIAAFARFTVRNSKKQVFIDCVPGLLPYYKAIGFRPGKEAFLHEENGLSFPLVLDTVKHGPRLSNERSLRTYLNMLVKAKIRKLIDSIRAA
jgi:CRP-like cAMP-binding protein